MAAFAFLLSACGPSTPEQRDERIIARLGSTILTQDDALEQLESLGAIADTSAMLTLFQNDWIERQLLIEHASQLGVTQSEAFSKAMNRLREDLAMEQLLSTLELEAGASIEVTIEEATQFYEINKEKFKLRQPWVKVRHLRAPSREIAAIARQGMLGGFDWAEIAERYSLDSRRQIELSERLVPLDRAVEEVPELNAALRRMGVSEVSAIVERDSAWHVVQIAERREEGSTPDLDWIIAEVREWLVQEKKRRYVNAYIRTLYLEAEISDRLYKRDLNQDEPPVED